MKTIISTMAVVLSSVLFTACNQEQGVEKRTTTSTDNTIEEKSTKMLEYFGFEHMLPGFGRHHGKASHFFENLDCADKTETENTMTGEYTNSITFGGDCTDSRGNTFSGKIIIEGKNATDTDDATSRKITYENFSFNGNQITGTRTRHTSTSTGTRVTQKSVDLRVISEDGSKDITRKGSFTSTMTEGLDTTETKKDDVFEQTGNYEVTNTTDGKIVAAMKITTALVRKISCHQIVSGIKEVTKDGEKFTIDYGDGTCDDEAIRINADGTTQTINLKKFRRKASHRRGCHGHMK